MALLGSWVPLGVPGGLKGEGSLGIPKGLRGVHGGLNGSLGAFRGVPGP